METEGVCFALNLRISSDTDSVQRAVSLVLGRAVIHIEPCKEKHRPPN